MLAALRKRSSRMPVRVPPLATCSSARSPWARQADTSRVTAWWGPSWPGPQLNSLDEIFLNQVPTFRMWEVCLKIQTLASSVTEALGTTETHRHWHRPQDSTAGAGPAMTSASAHSPLWTAAHSATSLNCPRVLDLH